MPSFVIKQVLGGMYDTSEKMRRVAVVDAPTAMKALRKFADGQPVYIRSGRRRGEYFDSVATMWVGKKRRPCDFVAMPN